MSRKAKYKITANVTTFNVGIFTTQKPLDMSVSLSVDSSLIVELMKKIIPASKKIIGKHKIIVSVNSIEL